MIPAGDQPRPDPARGVYGISVAAELVGTGVQNLRLYERRGLIDPARTPAGTRRYSDNDLTRLRHIGELLGAGLNLAGIAAVLDLEADNARLRAELADTYARAGLPVPDDLTPGAQS
jgi:MerR family transcriptional regulator/heat shock protein HspR